MREAVNLRQLQYFIAVAEELSFRRAALRLCITQPPLSRQIKALEERLGAELFDRSCRQITLTDAGERFLIQARGLVRHSDRMAAQFRTPSASRSELRIGITTVIDASLFSWVEPEFAKCFPDIRLNVKRQISAQSIRELNAGALDVAIIGLPSRTAGLTVEHMLDEPMVVGMSVSHPAAKRRKLALRDLAKDNLYWFDRKQNPAYHEHCERVFTRLRFKPARTIEPTDYHVLLSLVAEGRGIAFIPRSLQAVKRSGIVYKDIAEGDQLGIGVALAYRVGERSEMVAKFVEFVKERVVAGSPPGAPVTSPKSA
ncbi:LysR family transcriptional regulator [Comamonas testosteroni]|uniref:LysR family transcriptional regulator n=1 Tax=Comamonas testosteroni TaxID=285 RepID=UPI0023AB11F9|nr:LysR family transcriptional regulator [Comamonas testosteroni]WEE75411.1 LysR family transcriptional regulator [Comamonas testosteroni]